MKPKVAQWWEISPLLRLHLHPVLDKTGLHLTNDCLPWDGAVLAICYHCFLQARWAPTTLARKATNIHFCPKAFLLHLNALSAPLFREARVTPARPLQSAQRVSASQLLFQSVNKGKWGTVPLVTLEGNAQLTASLLSSSRNYCGASSVSCKTGRSESSLVSQKATSSALQRNESSINLVGALRWETERSVRRDLNSCIWRRPKLSSLFACFSAPIVSIPSSLSSHFHVDKDSSVSNIDGTREPP